MQAVQRDFNNMCCIEYLGKRNFKHFSVQNPERKKMEGGGRRGFEANRIIHTILQKTTVCTRALARAEISRHDAACFEDAKKCHFWSSLVK